METRGLTSAYLPLYAEWFRGSERQRYDGHPGTGRGQDALDSKVVSPRFAWPLSHLPC